MHNLQQLIKYIIFYTFINFTISINKITIHTSIIIQPVLTWSNLDKRGATILH